VDADEGVERRAEVGPEGRVGGLVGDQLGLRRHWEALEIIPAPEREPAPLLAIEGVVLPDGGQQGAQTLPLVLADERAPSMLEFFSSQRDSPFIILMRSSLCDIMAARMQRPAPPFGLAQIALVVLLTLIGSLLLVIILAAAFLWYRDLLSPSSGATALVVILGFYVVFGASLLVVITRHPHPLEALRLQPLGAGGQRAILLAIPVWVLGLTAVTGLTALLFNSGRPVPSNTRGIFHGRPSIAIFALALLVVAVLAPICEEVFFRGMLYQYLRARLPLVAAVALSAGVFAAAHFLPLLFPILLFMGVMLAAVFETSRSLYASIGFHAANNALAVLIVYLQTGSGIR
jgi:membrane protease YdiL (CAAX protease family)